MAPAPHENMSDVGANTREPELVAPNHREQPSQSGVAKHRRVLDVGVSKGIMS